MEGGKGEVKIGKGRSQSAVHGVTRGLYLVTTFLSDIVCCSASDFAYSDTFLRSVVCRLSVVFRMRASCKRKPLVGFTCHL